MTTGRSWHIRSCLACFMPRLSAIGFVVTIITAGILFGCGRGPSAIVWDDTEYPVPMAGLLLNSELPIGASVSVVGYLNGPYLFLTEDHAKILDYSSSILVEDKTKDAELYQSDCNDHYVKVVGTLSRQESNLLKIANVIRVKYADSKKDCYLKK